MPILIEKAQAASSYDFEFLKGGFSSLYHKSESASVTLLATNVIEIMLFIAGIMAVIYLVYSGILYITAAGNPDAAKKGQQGILNAAIGIAVIVLSYFIAKGVSDYIQGEVGAGGTAPTTPQTETTEPNPPPTEPPDTGGTYPGNVDI